MELLKENWAILSDIHVVALPSLAVVADDETVLRCAAEKKSWKRTRMRRKPRKNDKMLLRARLDCCASKKMTDVVRRSRQNLKRYRDERLRKT